MRGHVISDLNGEHIVETLFAPVDLGKLNHVVKNDVGKKVHIMLR